MNLLKILFKNKEDFNEQNDIADINKITASDMNEIKNAINNNATELNDLFEKVDADYYGIPIGSILIWPKSTGFPERFLPALGQELNRKTYASLFAILGTFYGVGDGTTTFNLPNQNRNTNQFVSLEDNINTKDFTYIIKVK